MQQEKAGSRRSKENAPQTAVAVATVEPIAVTPKGSTGHVPVATSTRKRDRFKGSVIKALSFSRTPKKGSVRTGSVSSTGSKQQSPSPAVSADRGAKASQRDSKRDSQRRSSSLQKQSASAQQPQSSDGSRRAGDGKRSSRRRSARSRRSSERSQQGAASAASTVVASVNTPRARSLRESSRMKAEVAKAQTPKKPEPKKLKPTTAADKARHDQTYFYLEWAIKVLDTYRSQILITQHKPLVDKLNKANPGGHREQKSLRLKLHVVAEGQADDAPLLKAPSEENLNTPASRYRPLMKLKPTCLYEMAVNWRLHRLASIVENCIPLMRQLVTYMKRVDGRYYGELNIERHVVAIFDAARALAYVFDMEVVRDEARDGDKMTNVATGLPNPTNNLDPLKPASKVLLNAYQIRINYFRMVVSKILDSLKGSFEFIMTKELQKEHLGGMTKSTTDQLIDQLTTAPEFRLVGTLESATRINALLQRK